MPTTSALCFDVSLSADAAFLDKPFVTNWRKVGHTSVIAEDWSIFCSLPVRTDLVTSDVGPTGLD